MNLSQSVAIVTGAGRGIGKAVALDLAREKASVVVAARSRDEVDKTVGEIESLGARGLGLALDLSTEASQDALVEAALTRFGAVDILVNNAAVLFASTLMETSVREWDDTFALNLRAPFLLSQKVMRHMIPRKKGHIINISSTAALTPGTVSAAYAISKRGLEALTMVLREEGKKHGIRASTVYPGYTDTRMLREFNVPNIPDKRLLPEDISSCVLFLLKQNDRMEPGDIVARSAK